MSKGKNKIQWRLIPLDLENPRTLKCDEVRVIPLNSSKPLVDPRNKPVSIPSAPKIYFCWPKGVPQKASETNRNEYFELKSPTYPWHTPSSDQQSINCDLSQDDKLLSKTQDVKPQPESDLEEGEIPASECINDSRIPGPMVKRYKSNGWLNNKKIF